MESHGAASDVFKRFAKKGVFPWQMAFTLLIPLRNIFLSPRQLVKRLDLQPHMHVLEVGAGPGYFSSRVAQAIPEGRLVVADIQPQMIEFAKKRLLSRKVQNVNFYLCDGRSFDFPDHSFDRIFLVSVLGEVENRADYLREFQRLLKPNGLLSISELAGDPDKITLEALGQLLQPHGFQAAGCFGNKRNYTINFIKRTGNSS